MAERTTYQRAFIQVTNLWQHDQVVKELVFSRRLAQIATELMGVKGVRLYHDQALYKEPGGGITPFHADQYYWPLDSNKTCTVWIPLQDTPLEMGPLEFAVGSHRFPYGRDLPISDESEARLQTTLREAGFSLDVRPFKLGDVSFHQGWTFHRAGPNRTNHPRAVMTVIYMADGIRLVSRPDQDADRQAFLPGVAVGDVAASPLNPLLYP